MAPALAKAFFSHLPWFRGEDAAVMSLDNVTDESKPALLTKQSPP